MFVIKYKNRNNEPEAKLFDCSKEIITLYKLAYDKDMRVQVVEKQKINIYDEIQSHANEVDFERILKTIELSDDKSIFTSKQDKNIDMTVIPDNFVEAYKTIESSKVAENNIKNSEYFKSKGIPFSEFVKNYNSLDHAAFLKSKYEKKEESK